MPWTNLHHKHTTPRTDSISYATVAALCMRVCTHTCQDHTVTFGSATRMERWCNGLRQNAMLLLLLLLLLHCTFHSSLVWCLTVSKHFNSFYLSLQLTVQLLPVLTCKLTLQLILQVHTPLHKETILSASRHFIFIPKTFAFPSCVPIFQKLEINAERLMSPPPLCGDYSVP